MEGNEVFGNGGSGGAGCICDEGGGGVRSSGVPRKAKKESKSEQRVDIDDSIQSHYVDFSGGYYTGAGHLWWTNGGGGCSSCGGNRENILFVF